MSFTCGLHQASLVAGLTFENMEVTPPPHGQLRFEMTSAAAGFSVRAR